MVRSGTPVSLSVDSGLAVVRLQGPRGNALGPDMVAALLDAFREADDRSDVRGILLAAEGKLFCPGLDLVALLPLDRPAMGRFMERFSSLLLALYTCSKPVVAALHGPALAGGCVLALTADWRVLRDGAVIGLNEIRVGVPLPFGVAMVLRESVHSTRLEEVALLGRNYGSEEAVAVGLAHETVAAEGFEPACRARLEEFAGRDLRAFSVTKRFLRASTVERIRAQDTVLLPEFLDCWFSDATRARIGTIVSELDARRKG